METGEKNKKASKESKKKDATKKKHKKKGTKGEHKKGKKDKKKKINAEPAAATSANAKIVEQPPEIVEQPPDANEESTTWLFLIPIELQVHVLTYLSWVDVLICSLVSSSASNDDVHVIDDLFH